MGSGSSTSVSPVKGNNTTSSEVFDQDKKKIPENRKKHSSHSSLTPPFNNTKTSKSTKCKDSYESYPENNITELEKQVGQLESEKLDLQEQVSALEEQLTLYADKETVRQAIQEGSECQNTIKAKDQYIEQLLSENEAMKLQLQKLRKHHKKRLRLLNVQMTEANHQLSIENIELKGEIARLREENTKNEKGEKVTQDEGSSELFNSKKSIILALSTKVTEQETMIADLQKSLADAGHKYAFCDSSGATSNELDGVRQERHFKHTSSSFSPRDDDPSLNELSSIMKEMKLLQKQTVKRKKKATSLECKDKRQSSGVSRDSGIVSTGTVLSEEEVAKDEPRPNRVPSAASAISVLSQIDTEDNKETERSDSNTPTDLSSIRKISAYRNKRKLSTAELDKLLDEVSQDLMPLC